MEGLTVQEDDCVNSLLEKISDLLTDHYTLWLPITGDPIRLGLILAFTLETFGKGLSEAQSDPEKLMSVITEALNRVANDA